MNESSEDRLVAELMIRDLEIFNKAAVFMEEEIEPRVRNEVRSIIGRWASGNGWECDFESEGIAEAWTAPPHWIGSRADNDWYAWFSFDRRSVSSSSYELADMLGVGETEFGFWFNIGMKWFAGRGAAAWEAELRNFPELMPQLKRRGFQLQPRGRFFRPVVVASEEVAEAWSTDDFSVALEPIRDALDGLKLVVPLLDEVFSAAREKSVLTAPEAP